MSLVPGALWNAWYRMQFYADIGGVRNILRYKPIRARYYRNFWRQAAENAGASYRDTAFGVGQIRLGNMATFVSQSQVMLDSQLMLKVAGHKALTYELLGALGAPIPRYRQVRMSNLSEAYAFLEAEGQVVVKPASGTGGGRGVTTGIRTRAQFLTAARRAARYDRLMLVEQQVSGDSYRLLFLDGEYVDAIRRDPPFVVGDGQRTIGQLVKDVNTRRIKAEPVSALSPLVIDRDARNWLKDAGLTLSSVPEDGERVQVKRAVNENDCHGNVNVKQQVHPDIVEKCRTLASNMGVKLAGVDLMCKSIDQPFSVENCVINEINTAPGLHHHYLISKPADGVPVAEVILNYLFSRQVGVMQLNEERQQ